jgi:hypothetical protein
MSTSGTSYDPPRDYDFKGGFADGGAEMLRILEQELSRDFGLPTQLKEMMNQSTSIGESSKGFKGQIE